MGWVSDLFRLVMAVHFIAILSISQTFATIECTPAVRALLGKDAVSTLAPLQLAKAPANATLGDQILVDQMNVLIRRSEILSTGFAQLTENEIRQLSLLAFELEKLAGVVGEQSHLGEHSRTYASEKVREALKAGNLSEARLQMLTLIHDLGKSLTKKIDVLENLPEDHPLKISGANLQKIKAFQAGLQTRFPNDFFAREILPHEFGSFLLIQALGEKLGIASTDLERLNAEVAGHNAGYDPKLDADNSALFHFWSNKFVGWPSFVSKLRQQGFELPEGFEDYRKVLTAAENGNPHTVVLTAVDRIVSLTLTSQRKFSMGWPGMVDPNTKVSRWGNDLISAKLAESARAVENEYRNVISVLSTQMPAEKAEAIANAIFDVYRDEVERLDRFSKAFLEMKVDPRQPKPRTDNEEGVVVYRFENAGSGKWMKITKDGKVFTGFDNGSWSTTPLKLNVPAGTHPAVFALFDVGIFADEKFQPATLEFPQVLVPPAKPEWVDTSNGETQLAEDRKTLQNYGRVRLARPEEIPEDIKTSKVFAEEIYVVELTAPLQLIRAQSRNEPTIGSLFARDQKQYQSSAKPGFLNTDTQDYSSFYRLEFKPGDRMFFSSAKPIAGNDHPGGQTLFYYDQQSQQPLDITKFSDEGGNLVRRVNSLRSNASELLNLQKEIRDAKTAADLDRVQSEIGRRSRNALNPPAYREDLEYLSSEILEKGVSLRVQMVSNRYRESFAETNSQAKSLETKQQLDYLEEPFETLEIPGVTSIESARMKEEESNLYVALMYALRLYPSVDPNSFYIASPKTAPLSGAKVYLIYSRTEGKEIFIGALKMLPGFHPSGDEAKSLDVRRKALAQILNSLESESALREADVEATFSRTIGLGKTNDGRYFQFTRAAQGEDLKQIVKSRNSEKINKAMAEAGNSIGDIHSRFRGHVSLVGDLNAIDRLNEKIAPLLEPAFSNQFADPQTVALAKQFQSTARTIIARHAQNERVTPELYDHTLTHNDLNLGNVIHNDDPKIAAEGSSIIDIEGFIASLEGLRNPAVDIGRFTGSLYATVAKSGGTFADALRYENVFLESYRKRFPPTDEKAFQTAVAYYRLRYFALELIDPRTATPESVAQILRFLAEDPRLNESSVSAAIP